ncbi:hypothetical protein [Nonomuraea diastatica]|uniref:Uncharacterized protein n=1 Tax=Nonomuraea diastatica TaxID=1848329 RepID=A0A4R4W7D1_9ACTN|nr:hypothetical protein [Nonomuraea diastatica]TDD14588.1 hypothetical protein E1294_37060 [Nonomuraea diastatica]
MTTEGRLATVDGLLARTFPSGEERVVLARGAWEGYRSSGQRHHMCVLKAGQDFWDDRSEDVVAAAEEEIAAAFEALVTALTSRWGRHEVVDLWPYLESEIPVPEPMNELCQLSGAMFVWRPGAGRWVALAVGQADPEFPIVLLAAVGETSLL